MYLGNVMLLVLNLPLIGLWVKVLKSLPILFPLILIFCLIGVYSLNFSQVEITLMIGFGILGYLMRKFKFEMPPAHPRAGAGAHDGEQPPGSRWTSPRGTRPSF